MQVVPQPILDLATRVSSQIGQGKELFDVKDYIQNYDFSKVDFDALAQYDPNNYKRTMLYNDNNIDIYLIGWGSNQASRIHDHPDNGCVMRVLRNQVSEETYIMRDTGLEKLTYKCLKEGQAGHIKKNTILHKIFNETEEKSLSLHIYSPPNYKTKYYDENGIMMKS